MASQNRTAQKRPGAPIIQLKPNGELADKLRSVGLGRIVDSSRVRKALGVPIRPKTSGAKKRYDSVRSGPIWQRLQVLRDGQDEHAGDLRWLRDLLNAEVSLGNLAEALEIAEAIIAVPEHQPDDLFLQAHIHLQLGQPELSAVAAAAGSARAKTLNMDEVDVLGLGGYYQRSGDWDWAAEAYAQDFGARRFLVDASTEHLAELAFRAGLAYDRCLKWDAAEPYYRFAAAAHPEKHYWLYKLGLTLERQERWTEAARMYAWAASKTPAPGDKYRRYRGAYCLAQGGEYEAAYDAFFPPASVEGVPEAGSFVCDTPSLATLIGQGPTASVVQTPWLPEHWLRISEQQREAGDFAGQAASLQRAIERSSDHPAHLWEQLAQAQHELGLHAEAASSLVHSRLFQVPDGIDLAPFNKGDQRSHAGRYVEYVKTRDVRPDVILFESFLGTQVSCHPRAIFESLIEDPRFSDSVFVWVLEAGVTIPAVLREHENVIVAKRNSDLHLSFLATAGWLVSNVTFPTYFVRRPEQKYLNTWHGTPVKTLGKDVGPGELRHANVARNLLQATHVTSPCAWATESLIDRNDVRGLMTARIAEIGSARVDRSLSMSAEEQQDLRTRLGISAGQKVVLYAPTWRGSQGKPDSDTSLISGALNQLDALTDTTVLFRGHHFSEKHLKSVGLGNRLVSEDILTNDLLAIVDILVTDYSSVLFDFLPFDKPVVFYVPDEAHYRSVRGLYFDMHELPGSTCSDEQRLAADVERVLDRGDDEAILRRRAEWQKKYTPHEDGNATERTISFFFNDDDTHALQPDTNKPRLLFQTAMIPNGITTSLLNLLASIDSRQAHVGVVLDVQGLTKDAHRQEQVGKIPSMVDVIGRVGMTAYSPEEQWVIATFNRKMRFMSPEHERVARQGYAREFRRIAGSARFDALIEFEGIAPFWANLFASAEGVKRKLIWAHSDMASERDARFPQLTPVFQQYPRFDRVASIAPSIRDLNLENIASEFHVEPERFAVVHNQINPHEVVARSQHPLDADVESWLRMGTGHVFVTVGRLSIEKSIDLMVGAFADACRSVDARLIVVGSGALERDLKAQAKKLGVADRVFFAGQRTNPMNIVKHSDTFVLSSSHEGQPMVLGEAKVLNTPILSTDLPGTRDMLGDGSGTLLEHSREAFAQAMIQAAQSTLTAAPFDSQAYMSNALHEFSQAAGVELALMDDERVSA